MCDACIVLIKKKYKRNIIASTPTIYMLWRFPKYVNQQKDENVYDGTREHWNAIGRGATLTLHDVWQIDRKPRKLTSNGRTKKWIKGMNEWNNRKEESKAKRNERKREKKTVHKNKYHLYLTHEKVHWSNSIRISLWIFLFRLDDSKCSIALEFITPSTHVHTQTHIHILSVSSSYLIKDAVFGLFAERERMCWQILKWIDVILYLLVVRRIAKNSNFTGFFFIDWFY